MLSLLFALVALAGLAIATMYGIAIGAEWFLHLTKVRHEITLSNAETTHKIRMFSISERIREADIDRVRADTERVYALADKERIVATEAGFASMRQIYSAFQAQKGVATPNQLLLDEQTEPDPINLLTTITVEDNLFVQAKRGAGKTSLMGHLLSLVPHDVEIVVIDPHASKGQYPDRCAVCGMGENWNGVKSIINNLIVERRQRIEYRSQTGNTDYGRILIVFEEFSEIMRHVDEIENDMADLLNSRKEKMTCWGIGHSLTAKNMGLKGGYDQIANYDYIVQIAYNKATNERSYWICSEPEGSSPKTWSFNQAIDPGMYRQPTKIKVEQPHEQPHEQLVFVERTAPKRATRDMDETERMVVVRDYFSWLFTVDQQADIEGGHGRSVVKEATGVWGTDTKLSGWIRAGKQHYRELQQQSEVKNAE